MSLCSVALNSTPGHAACFQKPRTASRPAIRGVPTGSSTTGSSTKSLSRASMSLRRQVSKYASMAARMRSALTGPFCAANMAASISFWDIQGSPAPARPANLTTRNGRLRGLRIQYKFETIYNVLR